MAKLEVASRMSYDRRYENYTFPADINVIVMVDYVGTNGNEPGNANGVRYCRAEGFYRTFANATFPDPCRIVIGEMPVEEYDDNLEPIGDPTIDCTGMFLGSNIKVLPLGLSRRLIKSTAHMFRDCTELRHWGPADCVAKGYCNKKGNGLEEIAFLLNIAPLNMASMFENCVSYDGHAVNAINWSRLQGSEAAANFAKGCTFAPHILNAIVDSLHWAAFHKKNLPTPLNRVNLGSGRVTGSVAQRARELINYGIHLEGFVIDG